MISGEKKTVPIMQNGVSTGMTRCRNDRKCSIQPEGFNPLHDAFSIDAPGVMPMNDPFAAEVRTKLFVIGDIIPVSQKHL